MRTEAYRGYIITYRPDLDRWVIIKGGKEKDLNIRSLKAATDLIDFHLSTKDLNK